MRDYNSTNSELTEASALLTLGRAPAKPASIKSLPSRPEDSNIPTSAHQHADVAAQFLYSDIGGRGGPPRCLDEAIFVSK